MLLLAAAKQRAVRPSAHLAIGPTFSKEVVRIFQDHCQNCHHPGDIGPFSLMTYADAKRNAAFMTTWEGMYEYKEPIAVPPLTRFALDAFYDNSSDNYRNPNDPPHPVSWGEQTTDEMCMAWLTFTIDGESIETTGKPDAKLRGQL